WRLRPRIRREVLEASGLRHGPWIRDSLAGELEGATRRVEPIRIAYTGDTAPCRSVLEAVRGVDVLIHDSTYGGDRRVEAVERGHSSSVDAALIAREAGVRVLVLHHISARYQGVEAVRLVREARRIHGGAILSWDGMRIEVRRS
ncbi:MAG: MBL fold metallo-hydrolase, partial [Desulfurococcales archaeon]|nr:MBL fold metallo-hydrolase [Desulfurococcales archaeon]